MDYDGVMSVTCDATENDWLELSYAERKYVNKERKFGKITLPKFIKNKKAFAIIGAVVLCVAILTVALFADGDFRSDVFTTARTAYTGVLSAFGGRTDKAGNLIEIPCNVNLIDCADGVATFGGGRVALSFTDGKVTEITENSVTVTLDEQTSIIYGNLTTVLVNVGDEISSNGLIGKYDGSFCASVNYDSQQVIDVVASETQLQWNV